MESLIEGINISESGLKSNPISVYVRQICEDQWNWLTRAFMTNGVYCVEGAPGVGKSVITYWCVTAMAQRTTKDLIYVHTSVNDVSIVIYSVSEHLYKYVKLGKFSSLHDIEAFRIWLSGCRFDILVLDGQMSEDLVDLGLALYDHTCRSIIICTSFQALDLSSENFDKILPESFIVTSWTKYEYFKAMDVGLHIANFEEMYFYGGSSIRFILMKKDSLLTHLGKKLEKIGDANALLSGHVGMRSKLAVNSLMCILKNDESIFLSEYVTRQLSENCRAKTIALCRNVLPNNPSWQGWVAELEVLSKIRKTRRLKVWTSQSDVPEVWTGEIFEFTKIEELKDRIFSCDTFLLPKLWNQGGFDFLYKPLGGRLHGVNVTIARIHSFKPWFMRTAAKYLDLIDLDFVYLCRKKNFASFVVPVSVSDILVRKACYESL